MGQGDPCSAGGPGGEDELHFRAWGCGEGMRQERLAGEMGPTSVPSFILF